MRSRIITFQADPEANAGYFQCSANTVHRTRELGHSLLIDLDRNGDLVGIEILTLKEPIALHVLAATGLLSDDDLEQIKRLTQPW